MTGPWGKDASLEDIYWWWNYQRKDLEARRHDRRQVIDGQLIMEGATVPLPKDPYE